MTKSVDNEGKEGKRRKEKARRFKN